MTDPKPLSALVEECRRAITKLHRIAGNDWGRKDADEAFACLDRLVEAIMLQVSEGAQAMNEKIEQARREERVKVLEELFSYDEAAPVTLFQRGQKMLFEAREAAK